MPPWTHGPGTATTEREEHESSHHAPGAEAADLTWTVTVSDATGTVPLSVRQFNVQDEAGKYHWVQPVKGSPMPAKISKDQKVTFKIHTVASAGEGMVRWAPDGKHVVALWDYIAELD